MNLTKILFFNLDDGNLAERRYGPEVMTKVLGGEGLANYILNEECPLGLSALDTKDPVLLMTGPATGRPGLGGNCFTVTAKSPITGRFTTCLCEGAFGPALKNSGTDGLVLTGKASALSILEILDGKLLLSPAASYAGKGTEDIVRDLPLGKAAGMICIGKAGENRSHLAGFRSGDRVYGRGGLGAVFGARRLKALVAHGDRPLAGGEVPAAWTSFTENVSRTEVFSNPGLLRLVQSFNQNGYLYIDSGRSDRSDRIFLVSGETIAGRYRTRKKPGSISFFNDYIAGLPDGRILPVPDVISLLCLGPCIGVYESEAVLELYAKTLDLCMDPVAVGALISYDEENPGTSPQGGESFPLREDKLKAWLDVYAEGRIKTTGAFGDEEYLSEKNETVSQKANGSHSAAQFRGIDPGPFYLPNLPQLAAYLGVSPGIACDDMLCAIFDKGGTEASVEAWRALDIFSKSLCVDVCALYYASNGGKNIAATVSGLLSEMTADGFKFEVARGYIGSLLQYVVTDRGLNGFTLPSGDWGVKIKNAYAKIGWKEDGTVPASVLSKAGLVTGNEFVSNRSVSYRVQSVPGRILYLKAAFLFLTRAITALTRTDPSARELCKKLPPDFSFSISAVNGRAMLKMRLNSGGCLVFDSGRFALRRRVDFYVKNSAAAVRLFTFQKNLYESFAKGEFRIEGSVSDGIVVLAILDRLIRILLPYVLNRRVLKDPERLSAREKFLALVKLFSRLIIG